MGLKKESYVSRMGRRASNTIINAARKASTETGLKPQTQLQGLHALLQSNNLEIKVDEPKSLKQAEDGYVVHNNTDFKNVTFSVTDADSTKLLYRAELHAKHDSCDLQRGLVCGAKNSLFRIHFIFVIVEEPFGFLLINPFNPDKRHNRVMQLTLPVQDSLNSHETLLAKIQTGDTGFTLFRIASNIHDAHTWNIRSCETPESVFMEVAEEEEVSWRCISCMGLAYDSQTHAIRIHGRQMATISPKIGCFQSSRALRIHMEEEFPLDQQMRGVLLGVGLLINLKLTHPTLGAIVEEAIVKKQSNSHGYSILEEALFE